MNVIYGFIFGLVQGITEFLPVSSSAHLLFLHKFINLPVDELSFDVTIHLATLLAVVWFFRRELRQIIKSWTESFTGKNDQASYLAWLILLATIPAALAGYFWGDAIELYARSIWLVALMLAGVGALFILVERGGDRRGEMAELNVKKSIIIGLMQALALIPGVSRSGITIITGMRLGLKRQAAVKFSFLLSIPIIAGAAAFEAPRLIGSDLAVNSAGLTILIAAFLSAFLSAWLSIKYFLKISAHTSLRTFAYYRFALALIIVILFHIRA